MTHPIANTRTRTGLTVAAELDDRQWRPEWNYTVAPR